MTCAHLYRPIVLALLICFFLQSYSFIRSKSATWDETHYLGIGKQLLTHGRWDVKGSIIHAPLPFYLASIPFFFIKDDDSLWERTSDPDDLAFLGYADVVRGQAILSLPENAGDRLLQQTRIPFALLGVILGFFVYRFSKDLYGIQGGLTSLFFYTFCPNLLALSSIAVPDIPLALFSLMFVYFLWRSFQMESRSSTVLASISLGLALLSKYPSLLLLPVGFCLCLLQSKNERLKAFTTFALVCFGAMLILALGYRFDLGPYLLGLKLQLASSQTAGVFLNGENSTRGWLYYYLVAFALKTPIPVIILFLCAVGYTLRRGGGERQHALLLMIPVMAFFGIFSLMPASKLRYILAVYPFIFVLLGGLASRGPTMRVLICVLGLWHAITTISLSPDYLAFFNEFAGGPANGYKHLVDSNLDWGQDLKELKKYMLTNRIDRISLSYFGSDAPQRYGIEYDWLPSYVLYNPEPDKTPDMFRNRFLAISATNLQAAGWDDQNSFKWLMSHEPVAKIGYSIFVYDMSKIRVPQ